MLQTRLRFNPSVEANKIPLQEFANKTINTPLIDPTYKIMSASYLVNTGYINEGISALNKVLEEDPRNQDVLGLLAVYSQQLGNIEQAINFRLSIAKIDPWNAENYFQLGKIYRDLGNHQKMVEYLNKIESFAGMLDIANQAKLELVVK
jgi:tetratricopeptide (TPR) repeat protein